MHPKDADEQCCIPGQFDPGLRCLHRLTCPNTKNFLWYMSDFGGHYENTVLILMNGTALINALFQSLFRK